MEKTKIELIYNERNGLEHINDLEDLRAPEKIKKTTIKNAKKINKLTKKYSVKSWYCLLIPLGIIILIISVVVIPPPFTMIGICLGLIIVFSYFGFLCYIRKKIHQKIQELITSISEDSYRVVKANGVYKTKFVKTKNGVKKREILTKIIFEIDQNKLDEYLLKNPDYDFGNKNGNQQSKPINYPNMTPNLQNQDGNFPQQNILVPHNQNYAENRPSFQNNDIPYNAQTQFPVQNLTNIQPFPTPTPTSGPGPDQNQQPFGGLPQAILRPNPNILNPNYQLNMPMNDPQNINGNQLIMPNNLNGDNQLPFPDLSLIHI